MNPLGLGCRKEKTALNLAQSEVGQFAKQKEEAT
jgi:hypothetical protein